jgi:hypothetical protein
LQDAAEKRYFGEAPVTARGGKHGKQARNQEDVNR